MMDKSFWWDKHDWSKHELLTSLFSHLKEIGSYNNDDYFSTVELIGPGADPKKEIFMLLDCLPNSRKRGDKCMHFICYDPKTQDSEINTCYKNYNLKITCIKGRYEKARKAEEQPDISISIMLLPCLNYKEVSELSKIQYQRARLAAIHVFESEDVVTSVRYKGLKLHKRKILIYTELFESKNWKVLYPLMIAPAHVNKERQNIDRQIMNLIYLAK